MVAIIASPSVFPDPIRQPLFRRRHGLVEAIGIAPRYTFLVLQVMDKPSVTQQGNQMKSLIYSPILKRLNRLDGISI